MDPDADLAPHQRTSADIPTAAIPGQTPQKPSYPPSVTMPGAAPLTNTPDQHDSLPTPTTGAEPGQNLPNNDTSNGGDPYGEQPSQIQLLLANKRLLAIVGGGLLLLVILITVVAASSSSSSSNGRSRSSTGALAALPEVVNRPDGSLDLSRRVDTSKVLRAQKIETNGPNKQVNLTSGVSMLVGAIGNYNATSGNVAANGKKYIIVLVVLGNSSLKSNISLSYRDFKLLDKSNQSITPSPMTQQILNNPLAFPTEIKPGNQLEGRLIYEVSGSDQNWTLSHKESYHKSSDDSTFTIESKIGITLKAGSTIDEDSSKSNDDEEGSEDSSNNSDGNSRKKNNSDEPDLEAAPDEDN